MREKRPKLVQKILLEKYGECDRIQRKHVLKKRAIPWYAVIKPVNHTLKMQKKEKKKKLFSERMNVYSNLIT